MTLFKNSKKKFSTIALVGLLFTSTTAYAISQADVSSKFNEIVDAYLSKIVEEKMAEVETTSDTKKTALSGDIQVDLDTAKTNAGIELEQYIEERSAQHLINLEEIQASLKVELLNQTDISLDEQKAIVDARLKEEEDLFLQQLMDELQ